MVLKGIVLYLSEGLNISLIAKLVWLSKVVIIVEFPTRRIGITMAATVIIPMADIVLAESIEF